MSPAVAELVAEMEADRARPITPPPERYPDGPTARLMRQERLAAEAPEADGEPHAA